MDFKTLKYNARTNFKKNHVESALIVFIMTLFGGTTNTSVNYYYNTGTVSSADGSTETFSNVFAGWPEELILILSILLAVASLVFLALSIFVHPILMVGGNRYFLKSRKNLPTGLGELSGNFKDGNYWNIVKIYFLKNLKIGLWSILFVIPGIIKTYEYFLVDYILAVRPDIDSKTAFTLSKRLMKGHKGDVFLLGLSFFGWIFLSLFTFGLLNIAYVNPYIYATYAEFYCCVRARGIMTGIITPMDLPDYENPYYQQYYNNMNGNMGYNPQYNMGYAGQPVNPQYNMNYNPQYNMGYTGQPVNPQYNTGYNPQYAQPQEPAQYATPSAQEAEKTE